MLKTIKPGTKVESIPPGQLRKWFKPGEHYIIVLSVKDEMCKIQNMSTGTSDYFRMDFIENASILVADIK